ncbi:diphthine synthase [Candidatus Woesearchaeota archaeon]|nr:diphthine synthase [Candidatus Woesearchaeota archaeon]
MLYLIGLGLEDERDLTLRGYALAKSCSEVYLDIYTSPYLGSVKQLENAIGKKIEPATRAFVESDALLEKARKQDIALFIVGDVFGATTHLELYLHAKQEHVPVQFIHNTSILTAVGDTGLSLYKFGQVTSLPFFAQELPIESPYDVLKQNLGLGLHTLFLLDLKPEEQKYMAVAEALKILLHIENKRHENIFTGETSCIGCAALGTSQAIIKYGKVKDLLTAPFSAIPHCIIVPGKLHFFEEDMLKLHSM